MNHRPKHTDTAALPLSKLLEPAESPEECFIRASCELDLIEQIMLGFEFCGSYASSPGSPRGFSERDPLTSPSKLQSSIEKAGGQRGIKQTRRALACIKANSASPGETGMAMLLSMPHMLGGLNLKGSHLNYEIKLGKRARTMFGKNSFRCDMYWPEFKLAVEYESDLCHTGAESIANDSKRRNALLFLGNTVITITRKQMNSFPEMNKAAQIIASHLGQRLRPRTKDFPAKQFALRSAVLSGSSARSGHFLRLAGQNFRF
ncbi:UNVERIFIED_ORG: hypothetical protein QOE_3238 [Clostridioides difficile F501]